MKNLRKALFISARSVNFKRHSINGQYVTRSLSSLSSRRIINSPQRTRPFFFKLSQWMKTKYKNFPFLQSSSSTSPNEDDSPTTVRPMHMSKEFTADLTLLSRIIFHHRNYSYNQIPIEDKWTNINKCLWGSLGRVSTGNTVRVFNDGSASFEAMWGAIDGAKRNVMWQTYICKDDVVGKTTVMRLEEAVARGVYVELLYDCGGNITGRSRLLSRLKGMDAQSPEEGEHRNTMGCLAEKEGKVPTSSAKVIRYRPFFGAMLNYIQSGMEWEKSPALRNHRKILICDTKGDVVSEGKRKEADGTVAHERPSTASQTSSLANGPIGFAGGLNIGDDYCGKSAGGNGKFRDTHCEIRGPAVFHLEEVYEDTKTPIPNSYKYRKGAVPPWRAMLRDASARASKNKSRAKMKLLESRAMISAVFENIRATAIQKFEEGRENRMKRKSKKRPLVASGMAFASASRYYMNATPIARQKIIKDITNKWRGSRQRTIQRFSAEERIAAVKYLKEKAAYYRNIVNIQLPSNTKAITATDGTLFKSFQKGPTQDPNEPIQESKVFADIPPTVQVIMSNPTTRDWSIQMAMTLVVRHCHARVWITTPYYMPHHKLAAAVVAAAQRGVDVRIIAGNRYTTDPWFMWYASQFITMRFLKAGVKIYEYDGGQIMHAKTVVVDSVWCSVGSYNWDVMSNKLLEVCVTSFDTKQAAELEGHFRVDMAKSKEVTINCLKQRSWVRRVQCAFFYYGMRVAEKAGFWSYRDPVLSTRLFNNDDDIR